jgi:hypothetical protein
VRLSPIGQWCVWLEMMRDSLNLRGIDLRANHGQTVWQLMGPDGKITGELLFWIGPDGARFGEPCCWVPVRIRKADERPEVLVKIELAIRLVKQ